MKPGDYSIMPPDPAGDRAYVESPPSAVIRRQPWAHPPGTLGGPPLDPETVAEIIRWYDRPGQYSGD